MNDTNDKNNQTFNIVVDTGEAVKAFEQRNTKIILAPVNEENDANNDNADKDLLIEVLLVIQDKLVKRLIKVSQPRENKKKEVEYWINFFLIAMEKENKLLAKKQYLINELEKLNRKLMQKLKQTYNTKG